MSDLSTLEIFVEVARCRSFSRAAERAGISQSAVSQRVAQFEKSLGVRLLDRTHRPFRLTEAGSLLLRDGSPIVHAFQDLHQRVAALAEPTSEAGSARPHQPLKLAAIFSSGLEWLGGVAQAWASHAEAADAPPSHPRWELEFASHHAVREKLLGREADLGIVSYPQGLANDWQADASPTDPAPGRWGVQPLREEPLVLVCPPGHRLTREPAVAARHLQPDRLLHLEARLPLGQAIADYLRTHTTAGPAPAAAGGFDNLDTLKIAVAATGQPAILPRPCVAEELARHQLAAVPLRPAITRPLAVVYRLPAYGKAPAGPEEPPTHLAAAIRFLQKHAHDRPQASTTGRPLANPANPSKNTTPIRFATSA